ncbi:hypothetical protein HELRODRAFT_75793 [Helobdella robusta]|uniref:Phospholipid/glycerol acyltransferase domain-containing protein n=1 Tax=Helobdella robusta TaxID=6412 RepID=T1G2A3_HELRO|nr:hypothetical protein HELRODRAFT_75793 [Helobdella robusta]ESO07515.1 hypothetical protein HELRODRAFT_75793 [Helobdella robusta]
MFVCALKYAVTAFLLLGVAPLYSMIWFLLRILTYFIEEKYYDVTNNFLYGTYQKYLVFFFEVVAGAKLVLYGDHKEIFNRKENVVYFSNHQCLLDWVVMAMLAERASASNRTRFILKDSLKYIPMYGFHFKKHGYIYVKRGGQFDSEQYVTQLDKFNRQDNPFWLVIYPEGHRLNPGNPQAIRKAQQYTLDHNLPAFKHLLTPRLKAFSLCVDVLKKKIDAIYDVTIAFSSTLSHTTTETQFITNRLPSPSYLDLFKGDMTIHIHMKRIEFSQVPVTSESFKNWIFERFKIKDRFVYVQVCLCAFFVNWSIMYMCNKLLVLIC